MNPAAGGRFLGVDGGGTRTRAVVVDATGRVLGLGLGGPSNFDDIGIENAQANLNAAVTAAEVEAGPGANDTGWRFTAAFLGVAGTVSDTDRSIVAGMGAALQLAPPDRTGADHDIRIALAGGLSGRPGIALIVGTGSSCYGRDANGRAHRAGGWGHLIGDEGSGYGLGVGALKAISRAGDRRDPPTALTGPVLAALGVNEPDDLLHRLYVTGLTRAETAALAPLVLQAAAEGDPASRELLRSGGDQLAEFVATVAATLDFGPRIEVAPVGGLAGTGEPVLGPLAEALARREPRAVLTAPELAPVLGAALLAAEEAGPLAPGFVERLRTSGEARGLKP